MRARMLDRAAAAALTALLAIAIAPVAPAMAAEATTTTTVSSSLNPSTYGTSVTFTAAVGPSPATGSVQFAIDDANFGSPVALAGGRATSEQISTLAAGTHTVTARFTSDDPAAFADSSGWLAGGQVVVPAGKAPQAIDFAQPANRTYGDPPFTVVANATSGLPVSFASTTPAVCAMAGSTVTLVAAGACTLEASQPGNADYDAAPTVARSLAVSKKAVTVRANDKSRLYGAPDPTFDATFTGLVGADDPGTPDCATAPEAPKVVGRVYPITCTGASLATADYTYTFQGGTLTITPAHLTVTADSQTRQYGLPNPALTATLSGFVNGENAATAAVSGGAACTTDALVTDGVGGYPITCARGTLAAPNYDFPAFAGGTLVITPALAAPAVVADHNPAPVGARVSFTATVAWPTGTPTGSVTFREDATDLSGPVALDGAGRASFATPTLPVGAHAITAVYSGDGINFGRAASAAFIQVIGKSAVRVVLAANRTTWETDVPVTFTAALAPDASGVTVPVTGTVTFTVDGVVRASVAVAGGAASYASPALSAGSHTVVASYAPDVAGSVNFEAGDPGTLAGTVVANTVSAAKVGANGTSIYPATDGWRDTILVRGTRLEPLSVSITIYSPSGRKVRGASFGRAAGAYALTWNGRSSSGAILPAGRYRVFQTLSDAYGARKVFTSSVTLSTKRMSWRRVTISRGPRDFSAPGDDAVRAQFSSTNPSPLVLSNATSAPAWVAVGYQFSLPAASTYRSLSFQVRGAWTGTTAPKIGLVPWNGGRWLSMYSPTRPRKAMGTSATSFYAQAETSLGGIVSGRSVRAAIDSFTAPGGYSAGPFRYSISSVRLVVTYGILE